MRRGGLDGGPTNGIVVACLFAVKLLSVHQLRSPLCMLLTLSSSHSTAYAPTSRTHPGACMSHQAARCRWVRSLLVSCLALLLGATSLCA